ncbi:MAG: phosphatase PAP2 family protein [Treponema sp.]|nr:phosphatase PAP2 family protein [Treponema sp.]
MKRFLFLLLTFLFTAPSAFCKPEDAEPYEVSFPCDAVVLGTLAAYDAAEHFLLDKPADAWDGNFLNKGDINAFDSVLAQPYNKTYDKITNVFMAADLLLPGLFIAADIKNPDRWTTVCVMYSESLLLTYAILNTLKDNIARTRPYMYFEESALTDDLIDDRWNSFPSGHTSAAFCGIAFFSTLLLDGYVECQGWGVYAMAAGIACAAGTGACRLYAGKHFLSDVLTGAAIGTFSGMIVPWPHKKTSDSKDPLISKLQFTGTGLNVHIEL